MIKHKVDNVKSRLTKFTTAKELKDVVKGSLAEIQKIFGGYQGRNLPPHAFDNSKKGKLKNLVKNNKLFIDGSHNPLGAKVLNEYLESLDCNKHIIFGMMANKNHNEYISYFKNISSLTTIDIPNQPNSIKGSALKTKLSNCRNIQYKENVVEAIKSIPIKGNDIILITGSLYLAGEILNLN